MEGAVLKWTLAHEQVIKRAAQAVNVGPDIDAVIDGLLWGQVIRGADDVAFLKLLDEAAAVIVEEASQAHVENLDDPLAIEQQIARLDIAMDQPGLVRMIEPKSRLANVTDRPGHGHGAVSFDEFVQIAAVDEFENEEVQLVFAVDVVSADDVGMIEPGDGPGLTVKTGQRRGVFRLGQRQHLERDAPAHQHVLAQKHLAHAAGAEPIEQPIFAADEKTSPTAQSSFSAWKQMSAGLSAIRASAIAFGVWRRGTGLLNLLAESVDGTLFEQAALGA